MADGLSLREYRALLVHRGLVVNEAPEHKTLLVDLSLVVNQSPTYKPSGSQRDTRTWSPTRRPYSGSQ